MLALTRAWQAALSGQPTAQPLLAMLGGLNDRLGQQWVVWGNQQLAAVDQYEGRSKMGLQQGEVMWVNMHPAQPFHPYKCCDAVRGSTVARGTCTRHGV